MADTFHDSFGKVSLACDALFRVGVHPGPRNVHCWMKENLGQAIKWERISALIARWETERGIRKVAPKPEKKAASPPTPSLQEILHLHPDLTPLLETLGGALAQILQTRTAEAADDRLRSINAIREEERAAANTALVETQQAHDKQMSAKDAAIQALRDAEAEHGSELEKLTETVTAQQEKLIDAQNTVRRLETYAATLADQLEKTQTSLTATGEEAASLRATLAQAEGRIDAALESARIAAEAKAVFSAQVESQRQDIISERQRSAQLLESLLGKRGMSLSNSRQSGPKGEHVSGSGPGGVQRKGS